MDENKLHTVAIALQWEARYRKGEHLAGKGAFLPVIDSLDEDFAKALDLFGVKSGRLLDIGTGLGVQAMRYAQSGFRVTATDVSATAMGNARKMAAEAGIDSSCLNFVADNILMSSLSGPFDVITDRGCYTLLHDWMREDYCRNVYNLLAPEGLLFLKTDAGKKTCSKNWWASFALYVLGILATTRRKGQRPCSMFLNRYQHEGMAFDTLFIFQSMGALSREGKRAVDRHAKLR